MEKTAVYFLCLSMTSVTREWKRGFSALQRALTAVDNCCTQGVSYIDFLKTIPYPAHSILFPSVCRHIGELVSRAIGMYIRCCFSIPQISPDCLYVAHIQHLSPVLYVHRVYLRPPCIFLTLPQLFWWVRTSQLWVRPRNQQARSRRWTRAFKAATTDQYFVILQ